MVAACGDADGGTTAVAGERPATSGEAGVTALHAVSSSRIERYAHRMFTVATSHKVRTPLFYPIRRDSYLMHN
jgi:hypothetical protein